MRRLLLASLAALALAAPARAGGPALTLGAAEDVVKQADLAPAKSHMALLRLAGFGAVRITTVWAPGQTAPAEEELARLRNVEAAARLSGVEVYLAVYHAGSKTTPLTDEGRAQFAAFCAAIARALPSFRHFIVGNEPNLNRFWMPQFNPDGSDAAAPAYLRLLETVYDALKAVSASVTVIGGAVSPRGIDRPGTGRDTHSPTAFIRDLGAAYRASGRTLPVMDAFAIHPYQDNSSQAPAFQHPRTTVITIADYGKLASLLGQAFDGTAQPGSTLPIVYAEYGVEARIPGEQAGAYTGKEPATTRPVDEATQAAYYAQALQLAFCQRNVVAMFLFHTLDEPDLDRWQSGVYYADGTPKTSLAGVRAAVEQARRGVLADCDGLKVTPLVRGALWPRGSGLRAPALGFRLETDVDAAYEAELQRLPRPRVVARAGGALTGRIAARIVFPEGALAPGEYRIVVRLTAARNAGPPARVVSPAFRVP